jgi:hypothetical protein
VRGELRPSQLGVDENATLLENIVKVVTPGALALVQDD